MSSLPNNHTAETVSRWLDRVSALPSTDARTRARVLEPAAINELGHLLSVLPPPLEAGGPPADLVLSLGRIARHFGYDREALALFELTYRQAPTDEPYRELWTELSRSRQVGRAAHHRSPRFRYLVTRIRQILVERGIRYYGLSFHGSGLGDQFMTSLAAAKLSEMLGLHYRGVVAERIYRRGRIEALFAGAQGWYDIAFDGGLATFPDAAGFTLGLPMGRIDDILIELHKALGEQQGSRDTLTLMMGAQAGALLLPELVDVRGSYLDSEFARAVQVANASNRILSPTNAAGRRQILIHLRLGDVVNIPHVVPGKLLIPHALVNDDVVLELVDNEKIVGHPREDRVPGMLALARRMHAACSGFADMTLVTDGYTRVLQNLDKPRFIEQVGKEIGPFDSARVRAHFQEREQDLLATFGGLGTVIYGEDANNFVDSIRALKFADLIITSGGQFSNAVANFLATSRHKQLLYSYNRDLRFIIARPELDVRFLGTDPEANAREILHAIQDLGAAPL